jgi:hypothetical protein
LDTPPLPHSGTPPRVVDILEKIHREFSAKDVYFYKGIPNKIINEVVIQVIIISVS